MNNIYIDPLNGKDNWNNNICTCNNTCKSLKCALSNTNYIHLILVNGNYDDINNTNLSIENRTFLNITSQYDNTLNNNVEFNGISYQSKPIFSVKNSENIYISGIQITNTKRSALIIDNVNNMYFDNLIISNSRLQPPIDIKSSSNIFIKNSQFKDNGQVGASAVVSVDESSVYFDNIKFDKNNAVSVIDLVTGNSEEISKKYSLNITNSEFTNNGEMGIVIRAQSGELSADIYNVSFIDNGGFSPGDVLRVTSLNIAPVITIEKSMFIRNTVEYAAINVIGGCNVELSIDNCEISKNLGGSALYKQGLGNLTIKNTVIEMNDNSEPIVKGVNDGGGGIQISGNALLTNVTFNTNLAAQGGGIYIGGPNHHVIIDNCIFEKNTAYLDGGAIFSICDINSECKTHVINTIFTNNKIAPQSLNGKVGNPSMVSVADGAYIMMDDCSVSCDNEPNVLVCDSSSHIYVNNQLMCNTAANACKSQSLIVAGVLITIMGLLACVILSAVWYRRWIRKKAEGRKIAQKQKYKPMKQFS